MAFRPRLPSLIASMIVLAACGGGGGGQPPPPTNSAPSFTSGTSASVFEGQLDTGYVAGATDPDGDPLTFSIAGGADQALFTIDAATGVLSFRAAPAYSTPQDVGTDNVYDVRLGVSDGRSGSDFIDVSVSVLEFLSMSIEISYPTPNANLGGYPTQSVVAGRIVDDSGAPINLDDIDYVNVDGLAATLDNFSPGRWFAQVPVVAGPNTINVELGLVNGQTFAAALQIDNFIVHSGFGNAALDAAANRLLVLEHHLDGIVAVDLTTGERSLLTGDGVGSGVNMFQLIDLTIDSSRNRALVIDSLLQAVVAVDLTTGNRSVVSNATTGTGDNLANPAAITLDASGNRAVAIVARSLVAIDLGSGDRSTIAGPGIGAGPDFASPRDVVIDTVNNVAYIIDDGLDAIVSVDLSNGDRAIVSSSSTGVGPVPRTWSDPLSFDSGGNRLFFSDLAGSIISVSLPGGDRSELADTRTTFGENRNALVGMALNSAGNEILLSDAWLDSIVAIDLTTGTNRIVSSSTTGAGPIELGVVGPDIELDSRRERLLIPSVGGPVNAIDLRTGNRSAFTTLTPAATALNLDDEQDRALVAQTGSLFELDLDTGVLTLLSSNAGPGTGESFLNIRGVSADFAAGRAIVIDAVTGLLSVSIDTGDRTVISSATVGNGPIWSIAGSVAVDHDAGVAYVSDVSLSSPAIYSVDLVTGDRTIFADNNGAGVGPVLRLVHDLKLDLAQSRLFATNANGGNQMLVINLASGDREDWLNRSVGTAQRLNPYQIEIDERLERVFIIDFTDTAVIVSDLATGAVAITSKP